MKEKALDSIVSLFALVAVFKPGKGFSLISNILEVYLTTSFSRPTVERQLDVCQTRIREYIDRKNSSDTASFEKFFRSELEAHCYILSRELPISHRMYVLLYLIDYIPYVAGAGFIRDYNNSFRLIEKIAEKLEVSETDFRDAVAFGSDNFQSVSDANSMLVITDNAALSIPGVSILIRPNLGGQLIFLRIHSTDTILFKVSGEASFEISERQLYKKRSYVLPKGAVIRCDEEISIYYNDIEKALTPHDDSQPLVLHADNISYQFSNGTFGIRPMSFRCYSGEITAIMGGSGTGKTTLMGMLTGVRKPYEGEVTLNGVNVFDNPDKVKGYIGYVPQEDALIEELTAFDNLYYIVGLSYRNLSSEEKTRKVEKVLKDLDLMSIRNLRVGSAMSRIISGGQRKRLNIAIELIREPGILLLDEPTSGLSSADSENIMQILKSYARSGHMVVLNIHQPSSDVFKMFDKLLFLDQGGYAVYYGPAMQSPSYLKKSLKLADAHENECHSCGNVNPDDIFHLVQSTRISTSERSGHKRAFTPERWHRRFLRFSMEEERKTVDNPLPLHPYPINTPSSLKQYLIYFNRNGKTKFGDRTYLLIALFLSPLLALLLSLFSRYTPPFSDSYSFYGNDNIPAYTFMSVIVALFIGIMNGSGEIIKDRKILKRETFLHLSYPAYIFAKLSFLMLLSAIQMFLYVVVSRWVLQGPSGNLHFFLVMWSSAVCSCIMGLALSQFFKTIASVYAAIPFALIPQILFSGAVIDFNKINPIFASDKYVPLISEVMASRWAYDAILVSLYTNTEYADIFFEAEMELNNSSYRKNFLLPEIEKAFFRDNWSTTHFLTRDSADFKLIINGITQIGNALGKDYSSLYNDGIIDGAEFDKWVSEVRNQLSEVYDNCMMRKDDLITGMGSDEFNRLRNTTNKKVVQLVTDEQNIEKVRVGKTEFIRKMAPIYSIPDHRFGRSHLFSPAKRFGPYLVPSNVINIMAIWLISAVMLSYVLWRRPTL